MTPHKRDTQLSLRILKRIEQHTKPHPIKIKALEAEFGVTNRDVKSRIADLIDAGYKIGSSKREPMGVFMATHPTEVLETVKRMKDEGLKYLVRARKLLTWDEQQPTVFEQMPELDQAIEEAAQMEGELQ